MGMIENIKELIKVSDFFNSYQLLRYQKQTEYRTLTGGIISIAIIATIFVAFASMILDTFDKSIIDFTEDSQRYPDPTLSTLVTSADEKFMFGVEVWGYNLSSTNRLFDVVFQQIESHYGQNYTYTPYPLEQCTKEHWTMLPDVVDRFDVFRVGNWLCPTIGTIIKLQGKYTSEFYNQFSLTLYPCNNNTDPSRPCGTPEEINQFFINNGQWNYFSFYYVNSIINPAQKSYKSYYLEDRTFISFGNQLGAEMDLYLSEIDIESDNSIWPFEDTEQEKVYNIGFNPILYPYKVTNVTSYANFYIIKDPIQTNISRKVQKLFTVFSFMGGLIGAIMAALFVVNSYTSFAYQLALALELFKEKQLASAREELGGGMEKTATLLHYFQYYLFLLLKKIGGGLKWKFALYVHQCRQEIHAQLDVKGLIKRIIFLEYVISYILQDFHLQEMQLKRPVKPSEIKALRQKIEAVDILSQNQLSQSVQISQNRPSVIHPMNQLDIVVEKDEPTSFHPPKVEEQHRIEPPKLKRTSLMNQIQSEGSNQSGSEQRVANLHPRNSMSRRSSNLEKLKKSAKQGNLISKKLLLVVGKDLEEESTPSEVEELTCSNLVNRRQTNLRIATNNRINDR